MEPLIPFICTRCIRSLSRRPRIPSFNPRLSPNSLQLRAYQGQKGPYETKSLRLPNKPKPPKDHKIKTLSYIDSSINTSARPLPPPNLGSRKPSPLSPENLNHYWDTRPPSIAQLTHANHFFESAASPRFLRSTATFREFPLSDVPEVAFLGRSNVGKSSLLNAVFNRPEKKLAHVSKTPGRTQTMNLYGVGSLDDGVRVRAGNGGRGSEREHERIVGRGGLVVVDCPGYGNGSRSEWGAEILKFLERRKQLRRAFLLVDAGQGLSRQDKDILRILRFNNVPHQIILSKIDKVLFPHGKTPQKGFKGVDDVALAKLQERYAELREQVQPVTGGSALGEIIGCSTTETVAKRRLGIEGVRFAVLQAVGIAVTASGDKPTLAPWTQSDGDIPATAGRNIPIRRLYDQQPRAGEKW